jgi:O-antigen/teichoic acid export membrane protein
MQPTAAVAAVVIFFPDPLALVILLCVLAALRMQKDDDTIAVTIIAAVVTNIVSLYISIERAEIYLRVSHSNLSFHLFRNYKQKAIILRLTNPVTNLTDRKIRNYQRK